MNPCITVNDPEWFHALRACPACAPPPSSPRTTCHTPAPPLPIDHVALSAGKPDGLYVAGKRLLAPLTFYERRKFESLRGDMLYRRVHGAERELFNHLAARALRESCVVRWRIEDGHPGAAEVMLTDDGGHRMGDHFKTELPPLPLAYSWGGPDSSGGLHIHVCKLKRDLIEWAFVEMEEHRGESTNPYYDASEEVVYALPDEWCLPMREVCALVAKVDLAVAKGALNEAKRVAAKWGATS